MLQSVAPAAEPEASRAIAQEGAHALAKAVAPALSDHGTFAIAPHGAPLMAENALAPSVSSVWSHPGLWLVLGAVVAIAVWLWMDFRRSKR